MNSRSVSMMESRELKERRVTIIDNHHRSNKSKRFIANGGFGISLRHSLHLAILFGFTYYERKHDSNLFESFNQRSTTPIYDMLSIAREKYNIFFGIFFFFFLHSKCVHSLFQNFFFSRNRWNFFHFLIFHPKFFFCDTLLQTRMSFNSL